MCDDLPDLGPCCCCEQQSDAVRNVVMLPYKTPDTVGHGWGCVACGLPADGASYVACDACLEAKVRPRWICAGYPGAGSRAPVPEAPEAHDHNLAGHPEAWVWSEQVEAVAATHAEERKQAVTRALFGNRQRPEGG